MIDTGPQVENPSVPQLSNWRRRCFIAVVTLLELLLITAVVTGLIVLSNMFELS